MNTDFLLIISLLKKEDFSKHRKFLFFSVYDLSSRGSLKTHLFILSLKQEALTQSFGDTHF